MATIYITYYVSHINFLLLPTLSYMWHVFLQKILSKTFEWRHFSYMLHKGGGRTVFLRPTLSQNPEVETLEMCTTRLSWSKMKSDFFSCFFTLIKCTFTDGKPIFNTTVENNTNQIAFSQRLIDQSFKLLICLQEPYKVL